jgi:DNA-binding MarR family transcriptional regulator
VPTSIGFLIGDASRLYRRAFDARARSSGITAMQWRLLREIRDREGTRQGFLAGYFDIEPITLSRMIKRLVATGLIERRRDPDDRRAWRLYLTPAAREQFLLIQPVAADQEHEAMQGLTDTERAQLIELVDRVCANLSRSTGEAAG